MQEIDLEVLSSGGFLVSCTGGGLDDLCMYKIDAIGNVEWVHSYLTGLNVTGYVGHSIPTKDGGFALVGTILDWAGQGGYDPVLIKTDSLGWSGCNENNLAITSDPYLFQNHNYSFTVTTVADSVMTPDFDVSGGGIVTTICTSVGLTEPGAQTSANLYPNPFDDELFIESLLPGSEIFLYDATGRLVLFFKSENSNQVFNTQSLVPGSYFVRISSGQTFSYQHLVKVKR